MQISIEYNSIWQNSFLAGDCDKPISKENKREFMATSKSKNYVIKEITTNTVLGVLCRLIGDQRKFYQVRESDDYYFKNMEHLITHQNENNQITQEKAFIVNKSDSRPRQSTFLGIIPDNTKLFFSVSAPQLWSVIYLELDDVMDFIKNQKVYEYKGNKDNSMPRNLLLRIDDITNKDIEHGRPIKTVERETKELTEKIDKEREKREKLVNKFQGKSSPNEKQRKTFDKNNKKILENIAELDKSIVELESKDRKQLDAKLKSVAAFLDKKYPNQTRPYLQGDILYRIRLYAAALYLQAERMHQNKISVGYCFNENGEVRIPGFSKRGFNGQRDFLNRLAGSKKKTVGTPFPLTKASGTLKINIDVDRDKAKEIKTMIQNAGVSSFYLGKKGLAYVTYIDPREVRR